MATINTRTYNLDRVNSPDSMSYAGPNHSVSAKDIFTLARVAPKPTKDFAGVAKPSVKRVKTSTINATTGEKAELIFNLGASVPVGTPDADVDAALADLVSWLATNDAKSLFKSSKINL